MNCTICGERVENEKFISHDECIEKLKPEGKIPKLAREFPIRCKCGCMRWILYFDRVECVDCGSVEPVDARHIWKERV